MAALRTILVPLDGSPLSEQALAPAIALARASRATLRLMHIFVPYAPRTDMPDTVERHVEIERQLEQEAHAYLESVAERVRAELPGQVQADQIRTRPLVSPHGETVAVAESLRTLARQLRPDIIVMATHARGGVSRAWLGSVADTLVRRGSSPTLLIRPSDEQGSPAELFHHILVPLDGSALAEESLPVAQTLASLSAARLTLLHVIVPPRGIARAPPATRMAPPHRDAREAEAAEYFAGVRERLGSVAPRVETATVAADQPARGILEYVTRHDVDLIVMSTRGFSGVKRFMVGSTADKVLRGAPVPVLLTKPARAMATAK